MMRPTMNSMYAAKTARLGLAVGLGVLIAIASPAVVVAQQGDGSSEIVEPSNEQAKLNAGAVDAIRQQDYEKAVTLLEAALALGEMNVTWLNLGRAYHKLGKCDEARNAYLSVITAPVVKDPSPRLINAKADQYLSELDKECDIADEAKQKMAAATEDQKDGDTAKGDDQTQASAEQDDDAATERVEPVEPAAESSDALAWTLTGSGLVVAGAGVGAHFWAESIRDDVTTTIDAADGQVVTDMNRQQALDKESRANTIDTVAVSAIAVGTIVTGTGVYLLLTSDDVEAAPTATVSADGDVSVGLTGRF